MLVLELAGLVVRDVNDAPGPGCQLQVLSGPAAAAGDLLHDLGPYAARLYAQTAKDNHGHGIGLPHQTQQQMLGADIVLAQPRSLFLREEHHAPRARKTSAT